MQTFRLIFKEIRHRKMNFLLSLLAVMTAVTLFVAFFTMGEASKRETTRILRDMGFNLQIVPARTDMVKFSNQGFSDRTMPEEYVHRFSQMEGLYYNHLLATLKKSIVFEGQEAILTGMDSAEVYTPGRVKSKMNVYLPPEGELYFGYHLAEKLGIKTGQEVQLNGQTFKAKRSFAPIGGEDDIRITGFLKDVQKILGEEGRINEIMALECACEDPNLSVFEILKNQLAIILPDAELVRKEPIAEARKNIREKNQSYFIFIMTFSVIACAAWIAVLAMMNVRQRRTEIGIMRALGYGGAWIGGLFLGKSILVGVIGAVAGFALGCVVAEVIGPQLFSMTQNKIEPIYGLLAWSLLAAPLFAAISSFLPMMVAVAQDPAQTLREE